MERPPGVDRSEDEVTPETELRVWLDAARRRQQGRPIDAASLLDALDDAAAHVTLALVVNPDAEPLPLDVDNVPDLSALKGQLAAEIVNRIEVLESLGLPASPEVLAIAAFDSPAPAPDRVHRSRPTVLAAALATAEAGGLVTTLRVFIPWWLRTRRIMVREWSERQARRVRLSGLVERYRQLRRWVADTFGLYLDTPALIATLPGLLLVRAVRQVAGGRHLRALSLRDELNEQVVVEGDLSALRWTAIMILPHLVALLVGLRLMAQLVPLLTLDPLSAGPLAFLAEIVSAQGTQDIDTTLVSLMLTGPQHFGLPHWWIAVSCAAVGIPSGARVRQASWALQARFPLGPLRLVAAPVQIMATCTSLAGEVVGFLSIPSVYGRAATSFLLVTMVSRLL